MAKPAGFYIPRDRMPQIDPKHYADMIRNCGYDVSFEVVPAKTLRAHQKVNHARAAQISPTVARMPVVVSSDGYVLDGNHRWWHSRALAATGSGDGLLNIIRLGMGFDEAVEWLLDQPYVYEVKHNQKATPVAASGVNRGAP